MKCTKFLGILTIISFSRTVHKSGFNCIFSYNLNLCRSITTSFYLSVSFEPFPSGDCAPGKSRTQYTSLAFRQTAGTPAGSHLAQKVTSRIAWSGATCAPPWETSWTLGSGQQEAGEIEPKTLRRLSEPTGGGL